jgi:hypothetical protein
MHISMDVGAVSDRPRAIRESPLHILLQVFRILQQTLFQFSVKNGCEAERDDV